MQAPPPDNYKVLRARARELADDRRKRSGVPADHYANVLGELAFAQAFALDPLLILAYTPWTPFVINGHTCRVIGIQGGERFVRIPLSWISEKSVMIVALHFPATAAATLAGWIDDQRIGYTKQVDVNGDPMYRLPVSALYSLDDMLAAFEQRVAQEYALTLLIDRRHTLDGQELDIYWWTDSNSAAIKLGGKTVDYIYCTERYGIKTWFCVSDATNRHFKSWTDARDFAVTIATMKPDIPIPVDISQFEQHRLGRL